MRIGIIVDGQAEYRSIPKLFPKLASRHTLLNPLYADMQPFAPLSQIVGAIKSKLPILRNKRVQKVLILIDRETRSACPGAWAQQITAGVSAECARLNIQSHAVVVKNRRYENWLVSDISVFPRLRQRFRISAKQLRSIAPNNADGVDALQILKVAAIGFSYDKVSDAIRILSMADPLRMASNSRSFRRLLREIDDPKYLKQSLKP